MTTPAPTNQPMRGTVQRFTSGPASAVAKLNQMVDAINGMVQGVSPPRQVNPGSNQAYIYARITDSDATEYEWVQVQVNADGEWEDVDGGLTSDELGTAKEYNLSETVSSDTIVLLDRVLDISGNYGYWFSVGGGSSSQFVAKLTSVSGAAWAWTEQALIGGGVWADAPDGRSGTTSVNPAYELNGNQSAAANTLVVMYEEADAGGTIRYWFVLPNCFFPVKVQQTGGSNGSKTTTASYTYTARSLPWNGTSGGVTLGTGLSLARPRPNGKVTVQSGSTGYGVGFYDGLTFKLWDAGEVPGTIGCS